MYTQIKVFFSNCGLLFDWTQTAFGGVHCLLSVTIHGSENIIRQGFLPSMADCYGSLPIMLIQAKTREQTQIIQCEYSTILKDVIKSCREDKRTMFDHMAAKASFIYGSTEHAN